MKNKTHSSLIVRHQNKLSREEMNKYLAMAVTTLVLVCMSIVIQMMDYAIMQVIV